MFWLQIDIEYFVSDRQVSKFVFCPSRVNNKVDKIVVQLKISIGLSNQRFYSFRFPQNFLPHVGNRVTQSDWKGFLVPKVFLTEFRVQGELFTAWLLYQKIQHLSKNQQRQHNIYHQN